MSISLRFPYQNKFPFNAILATYQSHLTFGMIVFTFGVDVNFVALPPFRLLDIPHHPTAFAVLSTQSILNLCFSPRVKADGSQTYEQLNNGFH